MFVKLQRKRSSQKRARMIINSFREKVVEDLIKIFKNYDTYMVQTDSLTCILIINSLISRNTNANNSEKRD